MKLQPIRSKGDYEAALREAERLWDAPRSCGKPSNSRCCY